MKDNSPRFKLKIARWIYNKFPKNFCWAGLVSWAYSKRLLFGLIREFDKKKGGDGCKCESETHSNKCCYCGCWFNGKHYSEKDFVAPIFEKTELQDPPF